MSEHTILTAENVASLLEEEIHEPSNHRRLCRSHEALRAELAKVTKERDRMRDALIYISRLQMKKPAYLNDPDALVDDYAPGNVDDAFALGSECGQWDAAQLAADALAKEPTP